MKEKIIPLFLPVLQMITGCLAAINFFVLIHNQGNTKSIVLALAIAILGIGLGVKGLILYKKK